MFLKKGYRFRLDQTKAQELLFAQFSGACRFVYNRGLAQRKDAYEKEGRSIQLYEQNNELVSLKKEEKTVWLKEIHSQVLQQALQNLDSAFQNFFRNVKEGKKPGFPRFKCKGIRDSFRFPQGVKVDGEYVYLPKIGWIKFRKSREIEGEIKQATISREIDHWYISFSTEQEIPDPVFAPISEERAVGIDVGLKTFATMAAGAEHRPTYVQNPRFFTQFLPRLRVLSRRLSKKVKTSKNWIKAKKQLAKMHQKIRRCREDFAHKLSGMIVKNHDIICVEGLDIVGLIEKGTKSLSRAIADASWRSFLRCLEYKAKEQGKHFVETGKFFASTQTCSKCGARQKMGLGDREYRCPRCSNIIDRDLNSAILEKAAGMSVLKACGAAP